jgi:hypothetical protein
MSRSEPSSTPFLRPVNERLNPPLLRDTIEKMAVWGPKGVNIEALPFSLNDTTAGNETELQALVIGYKQCVDLPIVIGRSNYFANILRRSAAGDLTKRTVHELEQFIDGNAEEVWENSWVRFPRKYLGGFANQVLEADLLTDKANPGCGNRTDVERFLYRDNGHDCLRIPISYLLKLSLADVVDCRHAVPLMIGEQGRALMDHFLCDNTSPETYSFHVASLRQEQGPGNGQALSLYPAFSDACQRAVWACRWWAAGHGLFLAPPAAAAKKTQRLHLRCLLPGTLYESLPVGLEPGRK